MTFWIGVDGGGTSTRAAIVDRDGHELGRARVPGAVASAGSPEEAVAAVRAASASAAEAAGVTLPGAALWAGLAGAGHEAARVAVRGLLEAEGIARRVTVGTDVEAAFHDAFPEGVGVLLIAGTGSIAWARSADGNERRVGGRGRDLGDEGSGFALGRDALRLVLRADDGREAPTALRDELMGALDLGSVDDLVPWMERAAKRDVAALAPRIVDVADQGDPGALRLVDTAVKELTAHVRAARGDAPTEVVLWGGLVADGGPLRPRLLRALADEGVPVQDRAVDPARGAARLALREHAAG